MRIHLFSSKSFRALAFAFRSTSHVGPRCEGHDFILWHVSIQLCQHQVFWVFLFLSDILCFYLLNLANPVRGLATGAKWGASWILGDLDLISSREMLAPSFLSA